MIDNSPVFHLNYSFDNDKLLKIFKKYNPLYNYHVAKNFESDKFPNGDPDPQVLNGFKIIFYDGKHDDDVVQIAKKFCIDMGLSNLAYKAQFFYLEPNVILPWHRDKNGTTACINHILTDDPSPIIFEDGEYYYKTALLDVVRLHMVKNSNKERIIFRITFFDKNASFNEIKSKLTKR